ncbi:MAG: superoxide dismutase [Gemmataceae bacterium]
MKLLALEVEEAGTLPEAFRSHLKEEAKALWELYLSGIVREAYFRTDRHAAVLVLECSDAERAREVLESLPLVRHKLIHFEVVPLAPYSGFERLFSSGA